MAKEAPSKSDAIREAVKAGVSKPKAIVEWIKKTHNLEVSAGMVSTTLSLDKKRAATSGAIKAPTRATASAKLAKPAKKADDELMKGPTLADDVVILSQLLLRHGHDELTRIVNILDGYALVKNKQL